MDELEKKNEAFEFNLNPIKDWKVLFHDDAMKKAKSDTVFRSRFEDFKKKVEKDRYIREALNIIQEM